MGQKINPTTFRLRQKTSKETKWFLLNNYSDGLHNDIEIKNYLSNILIKKNILLGGTLVKRTGDSTQIYNYIYPLDNSVDKSSKGHSKLELKGFSDYKKVLSKICCSPVELYLIDLRNFSPSKISKQSSRKRGNFTHSTNLFLGNIGKIPRNLRQYQRRPYFKNVLNVLETSIISQNIHILSQLISLQLEKDFRHNLFLDFVDKAIKEYVTFYPSLEGIRIQVKGRVNGSERSRKETFQAGSISLQSTSNKLNYSHRDLFTIYGVCGLKIWMCFKN
jgi:ribosomal protein S3